MKVKSTDFQNKVGMYLKLAETEPVIITRTGKAPLKIVLATDETPLTDEIIKLVMKNKQENQPENSTIIDAKDIREERLKRYER